VQAHVTQNQLTELLESEGAKSMLERGEERGWIEPAELEAFALEHDLSTLTSRIGASSAPRLECASAARGEGSCEGRRVYEADQPSRLAMACSSSCRRRPSQAVCAAEGHPRGGSSAGDSPAPDDQ
jgi:hypothetical protein